MENHHNNQTLFDKYKLKINQYKLIFQNRKLRLGVVIIIALAIPLTVFEVDQVQRALESQAMEASHEQSLNNPPIRWANAKKAYDRSINKHPLTKKELDAKKTMVDALNISKNKVDGDNIEGAVFENDNITVIYMSILDVFNGYIHTKDLNLAKTQFESFLSSRGFSKDAICNGLNLNYYPNGDFSRGTVFDENPLACQ